MSNLLNTLRSDGVNDLLPADLADRLSQLGIDNVTTTTTGDVTVIRGTVRPLAERGLPQLGTLQIEAPGLTGGLRAQLAVRRNGSGQVTQWAVDLDLDRLAIAVPGLRPAREVREPARATRLADEPSRRDIRIVGRGVLRITAAGGAAPEVRLIDVLDAATPFGDHGALGGPVGSYAARELRQPDGSYLLRDTTLPPSGTTYVVEVTDTLGRRGARVVVGTLT